MPGETVNPEAIKEAVREHYGRAAQRASQPRSCCGATGSSCRDRGETRIYAAEELAAVPPEAATSSFGCGNPVALATLRAGEVVLDLGSGGGMDVLLAAQRVGPDGFVHGLDMTDEMLELARRNAARAGATNVAFLKGDMEAMPLPDASVDVIISNCVINLSPDKAQVLHEAWRVLRPGGRLAVSDIVIDGSLQGFPVGEETIRKALSWAGCIAGALTADQYRQFLVDAGFEAIGVEVQHRFTVADIAGFLPELPETASRLTPPVLRDLVGRFTSSAISATKPR